jgi:hyperosmotically inducible periplasmic protein
MKKDESMKRMISLAFVLLAAACEKGSSNGSTASQAEPARDQAGVPADNTGKNERDRQPAALTSGDQGGSEADRTVTQKVRQGVSGNDALSVNGKNVKIITLDGVVTLRGPVKTDKERAEIASIAKSVDGVKSVDNQLEVATN